MNNSVKDPLIACEFSLSDKEFEYIILKVYEYAGISLTSRKKDMVYSRLARRLRTLKINTFKEYFSFLDQKGTSEITHFINAVTTNLTHYFRESHHFKFISKVFMPEVMHKIGSKSVKVWSAGCSTGAEPYSIAMTFLDVNSNVNIKILASDLDTNVLGQAQNGAIPPSEIVNIPDDFLKKYTVYDKVDDIWYVNDKVKSLVYLKQLNLMDTQWPMKGPFDIIFCRNVVIYFNNDDQQRLFQRFHDLLRPGGYLMLGHSEHLGKMNAKFDSIGRTIFRRKI